MFLICLQGYDTNMSFFNLFFDLHFLSDLTLGTG